MALTQYFRDLLLLGELEGLGEETSWQINRG
jgi:hypothetical protein